MARGDRSKVHHWWPVGLQQYWTDTFEYLSWVEPDGTIQKKKPANRKVARKQHGHTMLKGSVWETNFESIFDVDNDVHQVVAGIRDLKPFGQNPSDFFTLPKLLRKKDRTLRDMCRFYSIEDKFHRKLLLLLYSLLIRSPAARSRFEDYPNMIGLPADEEVGKANMFQYYRIAKKLCQNGLISNQNFVLLHSPLKRFVFGDGILDWLTSSLTVNRISGRALVPLTPHICVYFCTAMATRTAPNCASLSAAPWMVDWVNQIIQIHSKDQLFFVGKPPKLIDAFCQQRFLEYKEKTDSLIDMLDRIVSPRSQHVSISTGFN